MSGAIGEILDDALAGDNSCAACGGAVPVTPAAVDLVMALHRDGSLTEMDPEGVRMLLVLGSLDAGCGATPGDADGRLRVSCPRCASTGELALAARLRAGVPLGAALRAGRLTPGPRFPAPGVD